MHSARRFGFLVFTIALAACAGDSPPAVQTAAVQTVAAVMTSQQAAAAPQSTPSPMPVPATTKPVITATVALAVPAIPDASGYAWAEVFGGLERPLDLQHAGDDRLFAVEQPGRIWAFREGQRLEGPFLDLRDRVGSQGNEQGLLGLAFHPRFSENGWFFVNYTDRSGDSVVARFNLTSDADRADPASERRLLFLDQPYPNHNGGGLAFGPDGYLYIGTGDGGSGGDPLGNGQSLNTLLGKMLRIDVDLGQPYAIPPDNPFSGSGEVSQEIWASGLRNPWRFAFDRASGDLYIGDVGQGEWEEVNWQPASSPGGENYGWNVREGLHAFTGDSAAGMVEPVAEYGHDQGCSITGGVVVRDLALPEWEGVYLYGDFCSGRIWGLLRTGASSSESSLLFDTDFSITSFGQDALGGVYVVDRNGGVYRLIPAG
jgi:glucose/arabinose dehydrogenase